MKKKFNGTGLLKIAGWVMVAVGGIITSWASDKETKKQNDENFEKYISEKTESES